MAYINTITNEYPVSELDIRLANPNTSFPVPFQASEPYAPVLESPLPNIPNPVLQRAREVTPQQDSLGNWMRTYEVVDIYSEYTDELGVTHTKLEQEAEAIARDEQVKKLANKQQAERLLLESDWYESPSVSDVTQPIYLENIEEIISYRVQLRLLATNPPVVVETWPIKPDNVWSQGAA